MDAVNKEQPAAEGRQAWFSSTSNVQHPLLLAMPYPDNVTPFLRALQENLDAAMEISKTPKERISAVENMFELVHNERPLASEAHSLLTEIIKLAGKSLHSHQLSDMQLQLILETSNIEIAYSSRTSSGFCAPFLVRDNEPLSVGTRINADAVSCMRCVVERLERMSKTEIAGLGPDECLASIRILFVYVQFGWLPPRTEAISPTARAFLESTGQSLWQALLNGVPPEHQFDISGFDDIYGLPALYQIKHRLGMEVDLPPFKRSNSVSQSAPSSSPLPAAQRRGASQGPQHVIGLESFSPATESEICSTLTRFAPLLKPLPVTKLPSVATIDNICAKLVDEFPWAAEAVITLFDDLRTRRLCGSLELGFTPTLLLGPPGVGKTRLVRRLAEELLLPYLAISIAGMDDSRTFTGTARGWGSGQPSPILEFLLRHRSASGLLLLDEIDKATSHASNAVPPTVTLLALLESENARCWFDTYLQSRLDLTRLLYIATANRVDGIPGPLLSRMSVLVIHRPSAEQLFRAVTPIIEDLEKEWSVPPNVLPRISPSQLPGSAQNVRQLRALVRSYMHSWAKDNLGTNRLH